VVSMFFGAINLGEPLGELVMEADRYQLNLNEAKEMLQKEKF